MPFPLPLDPDFRKEVAFSWAIDVFDRINMGDIAGAELSLKTAHSLIMSLPPGQANHILDMVYGEARVKLEQYTNTNKA